MFTRFVRGFFHVQIILYSAFVFADAQPRSDTLKITIKQAEDQFLKNNLLLIIQRYNIDNAGAQVITARLFPNPNFNFSTTAFAPAMPHRGWPIKTSRSAFRSFFQPQANAIRTSAWQISPWNRPGTSFST